MITLKVLCIISLIPIIYPVSKFFRRIDLNAFDVLLLFLSLYYCLIPLFGGKEDFIFSKVIYDIDIQLSVFIYYNLFIYTFLVVNIFWTNSKHGNQPNLINLSLFIRKKSSELVFPEKLIILYLIVLIISYYHYVKSLEASILVINLDYSMIRESAKEVSSTQRLITNLWTGLKNFTFVLMSLNFFYLKTTKIKRLLFVIIFIAFLLLFMFGSRTRFLGYICMVLFIYYSIYISLFKWSNIVKFLLIGVFVIYFIFPLVAIFRVAMRTLSADNLSSVQNIERMITIGIDNYSEMKEVTKGAMGTRSLAVFESYAKAFESDVMPQMGILTYESISFALPKIIFPFKSQKGSQLHIEELLRSYTDLADSFLLFSKIEWGWLGPIACVIMFLSFFMAWILYYKLFSAIIKNDYLFIYPLFMIFSLCQFIEKAPDGVNVEIFQIPLVYVSIWGMFLIFNKIFRTNIKNRLNIGYQKNKERVVY